MLRIEEQQKISDFLPMSSLHDTETQIIKELYAASQHKQNELALKLLNDLIAHTKEHFLEEEKLMQDAAFEGYDLHKFEHTKQLLDLESILSFYEMTQDINSVFTYVKDSLTPWIIKHVDELDAPTAEFLKNTQNRGE